MGLGLVILAANGIIEKVALQPKALLNGMGKNIIQKGD
jgi:hypothetical protein